MGVLSDSSSSSSHVPFVTVTTPSHPLNYIPIVELESKESIDDHLNPNLLVLDDHLQDSDEDFSAFISPHSGNTSNVVSVAEGMRRRTPASS